MSENTHLQGIIKDDLTFGEGDTVTLDGLVQLSSGYTLTFEPGSILLGNGQAIEVFGVIDANGSADNLVSFDNVILHGKASGSTSLDYAHISEGQIYPAFDNDGQLSITNSIVNNADSSVWRAVDLPSNGEISHSIIIDTNIEADQIDNPIITSNTFLGDSTIESTSWVSGGMTLEDNNFLTTSNPTIILDDFFSFGHYVSSEGNYYGTDDLSIIDEMITDGNDDLNINGIVDLTLINDSLNETAPLAISSYVVSRYDAETLVLGQTYNLSTYSNNTAPEAHSLIPNTSVDEGTYYSYDVTKHFMDSNVWDKLTYAVENANGSDLPEWLTINGSTGIIAGTPVIDLISTYDLVITATDLYNESTSSSYTLNINSVNHAPEIISPIEDALLSDNQFFSLDVSSSFADSDGDAIDYKALSEDGSTLPIWLSFDNVTGVLSGTPSDSAQRQLAVSITATDQGGASITDSFTITIDDITSPNVNILSAAISPEGNAVIQSSEGGVAYIVDSTYSLTTPPSDSWETPTYAMSSSSQQIGGYNYSGYGLSLDMDSDGDTDELLSHTAPSNIFYRESTPDGVIVHTIETDFNNKWNAFSVDLDGDELYEIITINANTNDIVWWEDLGLVKHTVTNGFNAAESIYELDYDDDGFIDAKASVPTGMSNTLSWSSFKGIRDHEWNSTDVDLANNYSTISLSGLAQGEYKLYAEDISGNLSLASSNTLLIDNSAPTLMSLIVSEDNIIDQTDTLDSVNFSGETINTADGALIDISIGSISSVAVVDSNKFIGTVDLSSQANNQNLQVLAGIDNENSEFNYHFANTVELSLYDAIISTAATDTTITKLVGVSLNIWKEGADTGASVAVDNGEIIIDSAVAFDAVKLSVTDAYNNGINISDAIDVLRHIVSLKPLTENSSAYHAADVNNDDAVNISDAIDILRHIVGLNTIDTFDIVDSNGARVSQLEANTSGDAPNWMLVANGDVDMSGSFANNYVVQMDIV